MIFYRYVPARQTVWHIIDGTEGDQEAGVEEDNQQQDSRCLQSVQNREQASAAFRSRVNEWYGSCSCGGGRVNSKLPFVHGIFCLFLVVYDIVRHHLHVVHLQFRCTASSNGCGPAWHFQVLQTRNACRRLTLQHTVVKVNLHDVLASIVTFN